MKEKPKKCINCGYTEFDEDNNGFFICLNCGQEH